MPTTQTSGRICRLASVGVVLSREEAARLFGAILESRPYTKLELTAEDGSLHMARLGTRCRSFRCLKIDGVEVSRSDIIFFRGYIAELMLEILLSGEDEGVFAPLAEHAKQSVRRGAYRG